MSATDDNFKEIYSRINSLESKQAETNGYLQAILEGPRESNLRHDARFDKFMEQNDRYMKLVWRIILILTAITVISIFAIIYGAIGDKGLKSVRESVPALPISNTIDSPAIPWNDDHIDGHSHNNKG